MLLDEFIASVTREKAEEERLAAIEREVRAGRDTCGDDMCAVGGGECRDALARLTGRVARVWDVCAAGDRAARSLAVWTRSPKVCAMCSKLKPKP